jgi:nucleoside transporter
MPTLGLINTLSFHNMTDQERQFPLVRVFGTLGWIAAGLVVSYVLQADTRAMQFYLAGGAAIVLGLYSFSLPHTPPPLAGRPATIRDILCVDALALLKNPSFAVFMVCSFLICIPLAAYYAFAGVYVASVGFERVAAVMSTGQAAEVIFMIVMPLFFARLGVKWMLSAGMLAWVIRYALFAAAAESQILPMVVLGIALHGICYDFFFVTGQIYVDRVAPKHLRGQAQGLLVLITLGLGLWIGASVSARIVEKFTADESGSVDWQSVWTYPSVAAAAILLIFIATFRYNEIRSGERDTIDLNPEG